VRKKLLIERRQRLDFARILPSGHVSFVSSLPQTSPSEPTSEM
jgi:hypothetical protein